MKNCSKCNTSKPLTDFQKHNHTKDGLQIWCKECSNLSRRNLYRNNKPHFQKTQHNWNNKNRNKIKMRRIRHRFYISEKDLLKLEKQQVGNCMICNNPETGFNKKLSVDHCHKTNKLRGLLCHNCNSGLGFFLDSVSNLQNAIKYLENFQSENRPRTKTAKSKDYIG